MISSNNRSTLFILFVLLIVTCTGSADFTLYSSLFKENGMMPCSVAYRKCGGDNRSPDLTWSEAPEKTQSFALICTDPDAPGGVFIHWVIFNIPAITSKLDTGVPKWGRLKGLLTGTRQGKNDFGSIGFDGPCPPSGEHHYVFTLYALDTTVTLRVGATAKMLKEAMKGHVIKTAQLTGLYSARLVKNPDKSTCAPT